MPSGRGTLAAWLSTINCDRRTPRSVGGRVGGTGCGAGRGGPRPGPSRWGGATANGLRVDSPDTGAGPLRTGRPPPFHPRDTEVRGQRCPPGPHPDCLGHARPAVAGATAKPKPPSGARTWSTPPAPGSPPSRSRWSCCTPTTQTAAARFPWAFCPSAARCARPCDPRSYPGKPPPRAYWRRPHIPGVRYSSTSGTRSGNARSLNCGARPGHKPGASSGRVGMTLRMRVGMFRNSSCTPRAFCRGRRRPRGQGVQLRDPGRFQPYPRCRGALLQVVHRHRGGDRHRVLGPSEQPGERDQLPGFFGAAKVKHALAGIHS